MPRTQIGGDQVEDGSIFNGDIAASAAIDGTKISPNFGSQNVVTSGYVQSTSLGIKFPDNTIQVTAGGGSAAVREDYVATAGQTIFPITQTFTQGQELVFINGILQIHGATFDYTVSGNSVVMNSARNLDDKFVIVLSLSSGGGGTPGGSSGQVQFNAAGSFDGDASLFWDDTNKRLGVGTSSPASFLEVVGDNNLNRGVFDTSYATLNSSSPLFRCRRANGTLASPLDVLSGDQLGNFGATGYTNGAFQPGSKAAISMVASENWSSTAQGSYISFLTTANAGTSTTEKARIGPGGSLMINSTTAPAGVKLEVNGHVNVETGSQYMFNGSQVSSSILSNDSSLLKSSLFTAKGDLLVGTASGTLTVRGVGTNGQVLTADSAETDGVKWATPSGGGGTPGGSSGAVQFNSAGSFGGDATNFFWDSTNFRLGLGTATPSVRLHIETGSPGAFRLADTSHGTGKVLTSDTNGVGTWADPIYKNGTGTNSIVPVNPTVSPNLSAGLASVISGGTGNSIGSGADECVIAGGNGNSIAAGGTWSVIGGGAANTITGNGVNSILSGTNNTIGSVNYSVILGGNFCSVTGYSALAYGYYANASHTGSMAFTDSTTASLRGSFGANTFSAYFAGGAKFTTNPGHLWVVDGTEGAGKVFSSDANGMGQWVGGPTWSTYTVSYTALATAALTNSVVLFSLPAGFMLHNVVVKHSTSFTGGAIASYTVSVGTFSNSTKYSSAFDVFQATGNSVLQTSGNIGVEDTVSSFPIYITATSTGANLDQATQGSVTIKVLTSKVF